MAGCLPYLSAGEGAFEGAWSPAPVRRGSSVFLAGPSSTHRQVALRSSRVAKGRHERHRSTLRYPGFRFPAEIIGHGVWLYHRFTLSFRDIEDLLAERGIIVTHETIRQWCLRFGREYANSIRRRRPQPGDKWHLGKKRVSGRFGTCSAARRTGGKP